MKWCTYRSLGRLAVTKQVAGELGISEITVKADRGKATHKMQARTLAEPVRIADSLGISADSLSEGNASVMANHTQGVNSS